MSKAVQYSLCTSVAHAFNFHRALVIGSLAVIVFTVGMWTERRRVSIELEDDLRSLSSVLNAADLTMESLRDYLLKASLPTERDAAQGLTRLVRRVRDAKLAADATSMRLVAREGGDRETIVAINRKLNHLRAAVEEIDARFVLYRPGTISPAADLRSLALRDLAVLARYAEITQECWLTSLRRYLADEGDAPRRAATTLLKSLPNVPDNLQQAAPLSSYSALLDRLRDRTERFAPYYPGTEQSTYAQAVAAVGDLVIKLRAAREGLEGRYDIAVPEIGVSVPLRLLIFLAPVFVSLNLLVVSLALNRARKAAAMLTAAEWDELELDSTYDPAARYGTGLAAVGAWILILAWFLIPLGMLGTLGFLYRPLLGSTAPEYAFLGFLSAVLSMWALCAGRRLARQLH